MNFWWKVWHVVKLLLQNLTRKFSIWDFQASFPSESCLLEMHTNSKSCHVFVGYNLSRSVLFSLHNFQKLDFLYISIQNLTRKKLDWQSDALQNFNFKIWHVKLLNQNLIQKKIYTQNRALWKRTQSALLLFWRPKMNQNMFFSIVFENLSFLGKNSL